MKTWKLLAFAVVSFFSVAVVCYGGEHKFVLEKEYIYRDGELQKYNEYEYDANGNEAKSTRYVFSRLFCYTKTEYDANGNRTKESRYNASGELFSYNESEYDVNGNRTKLIYYNGDRELLMYSEYEYDANGNRTKRSSYSASGQLIDSNIYVWKKIYIDG